MEYQFPAELVVWVSNLPALTPISGVVEVSNFPAIQAISGTVSVDNFPLTQAVTGPLTDTQLRSSPVAISASSLPLPSGAATEATLSSLNSKVTTVDTGAVTISTPLPSGTNVLGHIITDTGSTTVVTGNTTVVQPTGSNLHVVVDSAPSTVVTGPLTDAQLRASPVPVNDTSVVTQLQTLNSLTPTGYDYISLSYTGDNLTSVIFKLGGAAGIVVSTLTLAYSGDNLISVTKS